MTKRFGFTLAEVLITLTIIGVIAAMTIPTLLSNTSDQEYKTGLKKAISTINQAITMQYALEGTNMSDYTNATATNAAAFATTGHSAIGEVFMQRMQVISTTTSRGAKGNGGASANAAIYLSDGMVIEFPQTLGTAASPLTTGPGKCAGTDPAIYNSTTQSDGCLYSIIVDVNGDKGLCNIATTYVNGKNRPKDCFALNVYPDGVRPASFLAKEIMYEGK